MLSRSLPDNPRLSKVKCAASTSTLGSQCRLKLGIRKVRCAIAHSSKRYAGNSQSLRLVRIDVLLGCSSQDHIASSLLACCSALGRDPRAHQRAMVGKRAD
ncbi:hypothetical protein VTI74DRAFT_6726 [Chaetomium olivicolor]